MPAPDPTQITDRWPSLVLPSRERLLDLEWGTSTARLRDAHPEAALTRSEGDLEVYTLTQPAGAAATEVRIEVSFSLDALVAVTLRLSDRTDMDGFERLVAGLSVAAGAGAEVPPGGYLRATAPDGTRLSIDRLDRVVRLEADPDP